MATAKEPPLHKESSVHLGDLLGTKLAAPILRLSIVRRTRLTEMLWEGMQRRLTLIVAPAGYGKTTLMGEWLAAISATGWQVAWVSLDAYDNDALRFWSYVIAALQGIQPSFQISIQDISQGVCDSGDCTQLNPLINEIAAIPHQFSLVLDDYHEIQNASIHNSLGYFINHLPENCHLILSSRVMPPLPFSRLRARGQLVEVTAGDLSFTLDEAETFLSQVMNLEISWNEIVSLLNMTEGWIAGLQLAALSLRGHQDSRNFIADFASRHRHILDYLTEEVLNHQDKATKDFLLESSVLGELSAPLCDASLGRKDSQEILSYLEQANLFIVPLDEHRRWYRYHALFADLLRIQLEQSQPERLPALHLAACSWLRDNHYPEKAVPHALAAGEVELAADIVESCAMQAIVQMDLAMVMQWFNRLSEGMVKKRPRLVVYHALVNVMVGKAEDLEEELDEIAVSLEQTLPGELPPEEIARLQRQIEAVRVAAACTQGDFSQGIRTSQKAIENLLPEDYFFLGLIEHYLAYAYQAAGWLTEGAAAQERACQNALSHDFHKEFVVSKSEKARFLRMQGHLGEAADAYRQAIDYADTYGVDLDVRIFPQAGLADILSEWNQVQAADKLLSEPAHYYLQVPAQALDWFYAVDACLAVARNRMLHAEFEDAARAIRIANKFGQAYHFIPDLLASVRAAQAQLWVAQGDLASAASWVSRRELQARERPDALPAVERVAMARVYLALERPEQVHPVLAELLSELDGEQYGSILMEACALDALALWAQGASAPAIETASRAASLAEPQGRVRAFVDLGDAMKALLSAVLQSRKDGRPGQPPGPSRAYLERLLKQFNGPPARETPPAEKPAREEPEIISPLVEALSDREVEVLALLSQGHSTGDIARALVISVNTAKAHIKSIYQKLDVHSRKEAIERAITLRLLQ